MELLADLLFLAGLAALVTAGSLAHPALGFAVGGAAAIALALIVSHVAAGRKEKDRGP